MAKMKVQADETSLKKLMNGLEKYPSSAEKAMIQLINEAVTKGHGELLKQIPKTYNIKKQDLQGGKSYKSETSNNLVKANKISSLRMQASIEARGGYLTLQRFVVGDRTPSHISRKNVKVKVRKGKNATLNKLTFLQNANGHLQVLNRQKGKRQIWRLLKTISVAHMASGEKVREPVQSAIEEKMKKRVQHYIDRELKKIKG